MKWMLDDGKLLFQISGVWKSISSLNESEEIYVLNEIALSFKIFNDILYYSPFNPFDLSHINSSFDEVTFFAGTFNPWHEGHLECVKQCPAQNLIIVPDQNPWKKGAVREKALVTFEKIFVSTGRPIYPGFLLNNQPNPTYDWIKDIQVSKINLLMGEDTLLYFHKWKNFEDLVLLLNSIFVCPRNVGKEKLNSQIDDILKIKDSIKIEFLSNHNFEKLSSSSIRSNM